MRIVVGTDPSYPISPTGGGGRVRGYPTIAAIARNISVEM
jgi:hypothetical protein